MKQMKDTTNEKTGSKGNRVAAAGEEFVVEAGKKEQIFQDKLTCLPFLLQKIHFRHCYKSYTTAEEDEKMTVKFFVQDVLYKPLYVKSTTIKLPEMISELKMLLLTNMYFYLLKLSWRIQSS